MTFPRTLAFAMLLFFVASKALGALKWDTRVAEIKLQRGIDVDGRAHFDCVNLGKTPVTILGITTACGCTTATPEAETIPPGQRDRVWVVFEVGKRHGRQEKQITLHTDDPDGADVVLTLKVAIAEEPDSPSKPAGN